MRTVLQWVFAVIILLLLMSAGYRLGAAFGWWGLAPSIALGWVVGRYANPFVLLREEGAEDA